MGAGAGARTRLSHGFPASETLLTFQEHDPGGSWCRRPPQKPVQLIPVAPRFPDATTQISMVSSQQTGAPIEGEAPLARDGPGGGRLAPRAFPSLAASSRCRAGAPREDP